MSAGYFIPVLRTIPTAGFATGLLWVYAMSGSFFGGAFTGGAIGGAFIGGIFPPPYSGDGPPGIGVFTGGIFPPPYSGDGPLPGMGVLLGGAGRGCSGGGAFIGGVIGGGVFGGGVLPISGRDGSGAGLFAGDGVGMNIPHDGCCLSSFRAIILLP